MKISFVLQIVMICSMMSAFVVFASGLEEKLITPRQAQLAAIYEKMKDEDCYPRRVSSRNVHDVSAKEFKLKENKSPESIRTSLLFAIAEAKDDATDQDEKSSSPIKKDLVGLKFVLDAPTTIDSVRPSVCSPCRKGHWVRVDGKLSDDDSDTDSVKTISDQVNGAGIGNRPWDEECDLEDL
jgi:hypothetical protein